MMNRGNFFRETGYKRIAINSQRGVQVRFSAHNSSKELLTHESDHTTSLLGPARTPPFSQRQS